MGANGRNMLAKATGHAVEREKINEKGIKRNEEVKRNKDKRKTEKRKSA